MKEYQKKFDHVKDDLYNLCEEFSSPSFFILKIFKGLMNNNARDNGFHKLLI